MRLFNVFLVIFFTVAVTVSSSTAAASTADDASCETTIMLKELWAQGAEDAATFLSGIYEHSAWVSKELVDLPDDYSKIDTVSGLAGAMKAIVDAASSDQKMELLRAHPDLAQKVEKLQTLTAESQDEQSSAGLQTMTPEELEKFTKLNTEYKTKFGFPFILAVRHSTKYTVLSALQGRVSKTPETEFVTALEQVHKIAWMRILGKLESDDPAGFLTCHVLDTANGCPAANMKITLTRLSPTMEVVGTFVTNEDGRLIGGPALKGENFTVGTYEWIFYAGDYFASQGTSTAGTPFIDEVPLRFGIDNPDDHYHVPLLVSPWSFSTYRGS
jgi:2-oxo-4-hydroxy-4-carboxy-5-ureidoimidazoline decarboxylase